MTVEIVHAKPQAPSKFLVIGEPFSGKTTLAAKSPKPIFISTDGNAAKAGLTAINVNTMQDIREALKLAVEAKEYRTIVIDTIEGIVDIMTRDVLDEFNRLGAKQATGQPIQSLSDVPFGKATGTLNNRISKFANSLALINKNVIILSYTKRQVDEFTNSIVLASELKNIRLITRFMDAQVITLFDGEKYTASIINKRDLMAGEVDYGEIESFLTVIGWTLPKKSVKVGKAKR